MESITINSIHQDAQKLYDNIHKFRLATGVTIHERKALLIMEAEADAIASLAFALGNSKDPTG